MPKNKLYITLIIILTLAFSTKAIANLTVGSTSVTSNGALTLTTNSSTLVLPTTNGTNGQVLTTNGSGVTSWTTVSGGGGGITNGAGNNVIPKSDGTNLVASQISDDGNIVALVTDVFNDGFGFSIKTDPIRQVWLGDPLGAYSGTNIRLDDSAQTIFLTANEGVFINGVKKYVALLTQSGTSAPVATVLENTLGGTVVWTRSDPGSYYGTLAGAFPETKTAVITSLIRTDNVEARVLRNDNNNVRIYDADGDGGLFNSAIEILVYP